MNILVTGSSGFLGSSLIKKLKDNVVQYDQNHNSLETLDNIELLKLKLRDIDVVYHLAGISNPNSPDLYNVNVTGTKNLTEVIKDLKQNTRIVFSSTFGVYKTPEKGDMINEDFPINPRNEYGRSKLEAEKLLLKNDKNIIIRLSNIYGTNMLHGKHSVVANFIDSILNKKPVKVFEKDATRDFIYIDDVVDSLYLALKCQDPGIYNICTGEETSIIKLIEMIEDKMNKKAILDFSVSSSGSGYWKGDFTKARKRLGWKPKFSLDKGLDKVILNKTI
ncbi:MAG: NAD(P)-dependent oxidoreductase [Patescibacteria group bacterium]